MTLQKYRLKPYCDRQSVVIPDWVRKLCKTLQPVEKPTTKEVEQAPAQAEVAPTSKKESREVIDKEKESEVGQPKRRGRPRKRNHSVLHTEDDHGMSDEEHQYQVALTHPPGLGRISPTRSMRTGYRTRHET